MTHDPATVADSKSRKLPFLWVDQTATLLIGIGSVMFVGSMIFTSFMAMDREWHEAVLGMAGLAASCVLMLTGGMAKVLLDIRETIRSYVGRHPPN